MSPCQREAVWTLQKKSGLDKVGMDSAPDMEKLMKDENYWKLLDVMGKFAKNHGKSFLLICSSLKEMHISAFDLICCNFNHS